MTDEKHLDTLLNEAAALSPPLPSTSLIERVLADAAEHAQPVVTSSQPPVKAGFISRLLAPIGGFGGAITLGCFTAFGVAAGAGYADTLLDIPGLESVIAKLTGSTDTTTPFETLSLLMTES